MAVAQFTPEGALDTGFVGGNGTLTTLPGTLYLPNILGASLGEGHDECYALIVDPTGSTVLAGSTSSGIGAHGAVAKLDPQGALDQNFVGGNGAVSLKAGTVFIQHSISDARSTRDIFTTIVRQQDGSLVAGGNSIKLVSRSTEVFQYDALARFTPMGALDPSLIGSGDTTTFVSGTLFVNKSISKTIGVRDNLSDLAITADGTIIGAGVTQNVNLHCALVAFFNPATNTAYKNMYSDGGAGLYC